MEQALLKLIETVENASETVWAAAIKDAYMTGISGLLWMIVFGVMIILSVTFLTRLIIKGKEDHDNAEYTGIFAMGLLIFVLLFFFVEALMLAIKCFANPEWHAIKSLIDLIE